MARHLFVDPEHECDYHIASRCVRGAFLSGIDELTGRDVSHRSEWLDVRINQLGPCFAVDVHGSPGQLPATGRLGAWQLPVPNAEPGTPVRSMLYADPRHGMIFAGGRTQMHIPAHTGRLGSATMALFWCALTHAAEWTSTEFHLQVGSLDVPSFAGGGSAGHVIYTLQHASGWKYGDNFFFVDVLDSREPGFQDFDLYSEFYANFSLGKISGKAVGAGPVSDVGLIGGFNWAADANVRKYVAGIRLALGIEGFAFANLDVAALIDDSEGLASGGAPAEDNTILVDFNFARPFKIGEADFSIEGHIEFVGERTNELGGTVESWILAQPQLQWHVTERIALGIEYQFWMNKLGDSATDENTVQALLVWEF